MTCGPKGERISFTFSCISPACANWDLASELQHQLMILLPTTLISPEHAIQEK